MKEASNALGCQINFYSFNHADDNRTISDVPMDTKRIQTTASARTSTSATLAMRRATSTIRRA